MINYDFRPISYYYNIIYWTTRFKGSAFTGILKTATTRTLALFALAIAALLAAGGFIAIRSRKAFQRITLLALMTTGFSGMALQIIILFSFQIIYGYLFYKLGLILTAFMIGLALGGWWAVEVMPKIKNDKHVFIWTQCAISLYPLMLFPLFQWLANSKNDAVLWLGSNVLFTILSVIAGFLGGFQFPLANKIYLGEEGGIARVAGLNYGVDLLGSAAGALLTGAFLIPIAGVFNTCLLVASGSFVVLILLASVVYYK